MLNLADADAVRAAAADLTCGSADELTGFAVQRMVPGGVEMLVGSRQRSAVRSGGRLRRGRRAGGAAGRFRYTTAPAHGDGRDRDD